jgi:hypothetical protein
LKTVHCRKCWQSKARFAWRCTQCGEVDPFQFGGRIMEMFFYLAVAAAMIGAASWAVVIVMF